MVSRALSATDDTVAAFTIDGAPVRGRYARLGAGTIDPIIKRHAYPRPVALLLGEALTLAALVGSLLKDGGTLTVQAEGDGPAPLLVAEYRAGGGLRGYARVTDPELGNTRRTPADLIGAARADAHARPGPRHRTDAGRRAA